MVPVAATMVEDLRRHWKFHRHPLLLFPNAGRGSHDPVQLAARMKAATEPMPVSSLQRLIVVARQELVLPDATVHTLRHRLTQPPPHGGFALRAARSSQSVSAPASRRGLPLI